MSELRLLAFLYSIWGILMMDERRKEGLVLGWLLSEEMFRNYFDHWCPIIRAYYMRLLCWRVARCGEEASELDVYVVYPSSLIITPHANDTSRILETLSSRLATAWSQFLQVNATAEARQVLAPSTAPCSPAPGRRLLIIRNDSLIDPGLLSSTFEGLVQMTGAPRRNGKERRGSANAVTDFTPGSSYNRNVSIARPNDSAPQEDSPKKKWGLLRNIKSLGASGSTAKGKDHPSDGSNSPPQRPSGGDDGIVETAEPGSGAATPESKPEMQHSFRFSLEWLERPHKPSKDRRLYPPRLPSFALAVLEANRPEEKAEPSVPEGEGKGDEAVVISKEGSEETPDGSPGAASVATPPPPPPVSSPPRPPIAANATPGGSKYVGRALAEWTLIVLECQNFFERRQREGVPSPAQVETPVLAMDAFRKH
jgi:hypothetical protein